MAAHDGRVSPVLDVAQRLLVIEVDGRTEVARRELALTNSMLATRVRAIQNSGAEVLICGAVSQSLEAAILAVGIRVIARVCGPIDEVLNAFLSDGLSDGVYLMPGCCGRGRQRRGRCRGR